MTLFLQDPNLPASKLLLHALEEHFKDAEAIYCAFAFVTAKGASLLFEQQEDVKKNLKKAKVQLIVGMDAITDTKAINKLSELNEKYKNFDVKVFLPKSGGIFHPKISWIKNGKNGVVIAGSGNLTTGGLKDNYEAFTVTQIDQKSVDAIEMSWDDFLDKNKNILFPLDAKEVTEAAKQNERLRRDVKKSRNEPEETNLADVIAVGDGAVFIEELTSGRGDKQRDVGTWAANHYFEKDQKLFITHVDDKGVPGDIETRKLVPKASKNYAIDLEASKGLKTTNGKMPVAIFIRSRPGTYFYHIIPPGGKYSSTLYSYLAKHVKKVQKGHARRLEKAISTDDLKAIWPNAPFWRMKEND